MRTKWRILPLFVMIIFSSFMIAQDLDQMEVRNPIKIHYDSSGVKILRTGDYTILITIEDAIFEKLNKKELFVFITTSKGEDKAIIEKGEIQQFYIKDYYDENLRVVIQDVLGKDIKMKEYKISSAENFVITKKWDKIKPIKTLYDSSGVSVYLINKKTGVVVCSNSVFIKAGLNKIPVYISNDINDQDKFDFSEASVSTQDESAYFNLENILDENGKGKFRLVIEKVFNKVFVLEGITKN